MATVGERAYWQLSANHPPTYRTTSPNNDLTKNVNSVEVKTLSLASGEAGQPPGILCFLWAAR